MHIVIIGNGIAGITAARMIRKISSGQAAPDMAADPDITVISGESGHFFSRTALMYVYMGQLRQKDTQPYEPWFWEKNRISLVHAWVGRVDFDGKTLLLNDGRSLSYDKLLIACGSTWNTFGWPGEDLEGVRGLYSLQDLEYIERCSAGLRRAVIVGGGLIGVELAEMFRSRGITVTFLVREESYWDMVLPREESQMISRHLREHGVDLRLSTGMKEIVSDGQGRAAGVITDRGERIDCGFVGLTAGVRPAIDFLRSTPLETGQGILVDEYLQTNISGVYAAGDCAELRHSAPSRRPIEAVWYVARRMGEVAAGNLCGQRLPYRPGTWFNSAKFFDIEYQVYGEIQARPGDHVSSIYWEHPEGRKSIRLAYDRRSLEILGFNLMGIRYRQEVCEKWIQERTPVETVLENLGLANFDPEFFREYESRLVEIYNGQTGRNLRLRSKRGLKQALAFLQGLTTKQGTSPKSTSL